MSKIKNSLVVQNNFLFSISIIFISIIWIIFYIQQKHQNEEHNLARYFNVVTTLSPLISEKKEINDEVLAALEMQRYTKGFPDTSTVYFERGTQTKGFRFIHFEDNNFLHIYNGKRAIYLKDMHQEHNMIFTHTLFILLVIAQIVLHLKLNSSLQPLRLLAKKLKNLQDGDRTPFLINTNYYEIKQIIGAYNDSIKKIDYMLETREMFNKIFMHEMKMPLAKGMFYLKQEPSDTTHNKLQKILNVINEELEEFSHIESLIANQNNIDKTEHSFLEILDIAKNRTGLDDKNIVIIGDMKDYTLNGDREFWILCIKNLLDNGVKYSMNKKVIIGYENGIYFKNSGEPLPVDISKDITKWKIEKSKRHKSSTGYGFGLFIIKSIVTFHNNSLEYTYNKEDNELTLKIV